MVPVRWGIRGSTGGNNISLRFRERRRLVMTLKTILGQMSSSPKNKAKNSLPEFLSLGLLFLLKALLFFLEKEGFLPNLFLLNPCFLKDLEKGLLELSTR